MTKSTLREYLKSEVKKSCFKYKKSDTLRIGIEREREKKKQLLHLLHSIEDSHKMSSSNNQQQQQQQRRKKTITLNKATLSPVLQIIFIHER